MLVVKNAVKLVLSRHCLR